MTENRPKANPDLEKVVVTKALAPKLTTPLATFPPFSRPPGAASTDSNDTLELNLTHVTPSCKPGRSTVNRLRSAGSNRPIGWNFQSAPSAGGGDRPIGCGRPDCRPLDGRSAVADLKKSSPQKRSHRNSEQNAPIGIFTALMGTIFVTISVSVSGQLLEHFWPNRLDRLVDSKSIGSIGQADQGWEKSFGSIGQGWLIDCRVTSMI